MSFNQQAYVTCNITQFAVQSDTSLPIGVSGNRLDYHYNV